MSTAPSDPKDAPARPDTAVSSPSPAVGRPPRRRLRLVVLFALAVCLAAGGFFSWQRASRFESTDDAFIAGNVTTVAPRVPGRVKEVLVADNQQVRLGDVLLRIDPVNYQARLDTANAALDTAQRNLAEAVSESAAALATAEASGAQVASAQATADNAVKERGRYDKLLGQRVVSQESKDNADTTARTAVAALDVARKKHDADLAQAALAAAAIDTARAKVGEAQAAVAQADLDLTHTVVHARVAGRVTNKAVEPGDYLQAGQAVMSLVQPDVWVVANFKETQLTHIRPGQPASLSVDAFPDRAFKGHVDSIQRGTGAAFSLLPPENATGNYVKVVQRVPVKIVFDDAGPQLLGRLAPGMSVVPTVRVR